MSSPARHGGRLVALAGVVVSIAAGLSARPAAAREDFPLAGCVTLTDEQSSEQQPAEAAALPEALRLPPTERELREMAGALARGEDALARLLSKEPLAAPSLRRIGVLVGDVRAVATALDAEQALKRLDTIANVDPATRKWMEAQVSTIRRCALRRFLTRGGEPAYKRTAAIVGKLRRELDPVVFRPRRPPAAPAVVER